MPGKYYYLVASLPYLKMEEKGITKEAFLSECLKWLSLEDYSALREAELGLLEKVSFEVPALIDWKRFDTALKKDLFIARESIVSDSPRETAANEKIKTVIEQETPLLMEKKLAQIKLDFIDGEFSKYFFDLNWLILYYLKIQILERLSVFDKDIGENFYYKLCEVEYDK